jgi:outer membrane receptor protein involved in Fe transport
MKVTRHSRPLLLLALLLGAGPGRPALAEETADETEADAAQDADGEDDAEAAAAEEVIITAPRPEADGTAALRQIDGQTARSSPAPSLVETVARQTPGMYVSSRGVGLHGIAAGSSGGIRIRGLGGSPNTQVLMVVDGVPDYQGIFGHPLPDAYVPDLIERVAVVPGGDSVLYGTNALGGVVAITSRWRRRPGCELHLRSGAGSYRSYQLQPTLLAHSGGWDLAAAGHLRGSDGHRAGAGGQLQLGQLAARTWPTEASRLALRFRLLHMTGADPGPIRHPNPDHSFGVLRFNASARLDVFGEAADWRAVAYAAGGRHVLHDGFRSLDLLAGGYLESRLRLHPSLELLLGAAGDLVDGRVENRSFGTRRDVDWTANLALYQQARWQPLEGLRLVAGLRQNLSSAYGFVLLYKAGARWQAWPGGLLRARLAANFRQPTLRERYLPFPVANPDLEPERSRNFDAGVVQRLFDDHLRLELTAFVTEAFDFIKTFGAWPSAEVVNIDHVLFPGVEGRLELRRLGPFGASLGAAWIDVGRYTKQNPSLELDAALRLDWRGLRARLQASWIHGLYQNNYGRDPLDDVILLDLGLRYRIPATPLTAFAALRNLLDRRQATIAGYPLPGFNLFAGLEVHL